MCCLKSLKNQKEMLTDAFRVIVNNLFKKNLWENKIKSN